MILTLDAAIRANTPQGRTGGGDESPPEWGLIDIPDWLNWSREDKFKLIRHKGFQDLGDGRVYLPDELEHSSPQMRDSGPFGLGEPLKVLTVFGGAIAGAAALSSAFPGAVAGASSSQAIAGTALAQEAAALTGSGVAIGGPLGTGAVAAQGLTVAKVLESARTLNTITGTASTLTKLGAETPAQASPLVVARPVVFGLTGTWPSLEPRSAAPTLDADQGQPFGTVKAADPAAAAEASSSSTRTVIASLAAAVLLGLVAFRSA